MQATRSRLPSVLGVVASTLGLFFSGFSTHDYALHLDRQLHGTHCSFIPGLIEASSGANACTVAMYSPYSALFRGRFWGGVPISLFALGAYAFFLAASLGLLSRGATASRRALQAFGLASLTPLLASAVMFTISLTRLGAFCKLCVGLYAASLLLAIAGVLVLKQIARERLAEVSASMRAPLEDAYAVPADPEPAPRPTGRLAIIPIAFAALGVFASAPAFAYVSALPDYGPLLSKCGQLLVSTEKHGALVKLPTSRPVQPALMFVDPLCPTCKAFHERLETEGILDRLEPTVAVFPLDDECNWMVDRALHPGACQLSRAFLCADQSGGAKARAVLTWSYENQEDLAEAGRAGKDALRAKIKARFPELDGCIDSKEVRQRLDRTLHFAIANKIPVSTPQLFLGNERVCDEDTDLGLRFVVGKLAPQVNQP